MLTLYPIHLPKQCVSGSNLNRASGWTVQILELNQINQFDKKNMNRLFELRFNSFIFVRLEPIVQDVEPIWAARVPRGQGAVAPPCMWIYRFGDKFSCRTMVSYPTPLNNGQQHSSRRELSTKHQTGQKPSLEPSNCFGHGLETFLAWSVNRRWRLTLAKNCSTDCPDSF